MSGLNSRAQALVDAIQFADEPSAADYDRIHDAIVARIAVGVIAGTALAVGTEAAASTVVSSASNGVVSHVVAAASAVPAVQAVAVSGAAVSAVAASTVGGGSATALGIASTGAIAAKVAVWVVAVGVAGGAVGMAVNHGGGSRAPSATPSPQIVATTLPSTGASARATLGLATPATRAGSAFESESPLPASPSPVPEVPGKKAASTVNAPSARLPVAAVAPGAAGRDTEEPRPPEHVATLEVELALMRRAHAALNDGDAEEALAALDEHARNFPSGALAEDRAAQRVLALCALGQTDLAREEGERFIADYSRSPHVAVVRGSCAFIAEPRR